MRLKPIKFNEASKFTWDSEVAMEKFRVDLDAELEVGNSQILVHVAHDRQSFVGRFRVSIDDSRPHVSSVRPLYSP